jgi:hypothetical protein
MARGFFVCCPSSISDVMIRAGAHEPAIITREIDER